MWQVGKASKLCNLTSWEACAKLRLYVNEARTTATLTILLTIWVTCKSNRTAYVFLDRAMGQWCPLKLTNKNNLVTIFFLERAMDHFLAPVILKFANFPHICGQFFLANLTKRFVSKKFKLLARFLPSSLTCSPLCLMTIHSYHHLALHERDVNLPDFGKSSPKKVFG